MITERVLVGAIEGWRKAMGLEKIVLVGHSFGAYQSGLYALTYPKHVEQLVLCDPWGMPTKENSGES